MERKRIVKLLLTFICLCGISVSSSLAESFEQVRTMAGKSQSILAEGVTIRGLIISDYMSYNTELNPNISYNKVDLSLTHRTAYIQDMEGKYGFRIVFESMYDNRLQRGMDVTLSLAGCSLERSSSPEAYTINGITADKITVNAAGVKLPLKKKHISELTIEDIYTYVTIEDVEFQTKHGAFSNIYETCTQQSSLNKLNPPFMAADGWASLLEDGKGDHIYMQLNSKCNWRRNNWRFPKGVGEISGIIVCNQNRRYGCDFGPYSIRPIFREDINIELEPGSNFRTIVEWNWNFNTHQALKLKNSGEVRWVPKTGVKDDAVIADIGDGELWTDSGCIMRLDGEYDSRFCAVANGAARTVASALRIDGKTEQWYSANGPAGIYIKTSLAGIEGTGAVFNFSFVAGNESYYMSWGCPAFWTVEYSIDGKAFKSTGFEARLRPLAFHPAVISRKGFIGTPYDAAMGFSEYSVKLPSEVLGKENLVIRIIPKNNTVVVLDQDYTLPVDYSGKASDYKNNFCLRIGMVGLKIF